MRAHGGTDKHLCSLFRDFGVEYIDGTKPPYKTVSVPGGGQMFKQYVLPAGAVEVDEFISVRR